MQPRVILSWQAKEYEHMPKGRSWYWTVGIIAAGVGVAACILSDYLFGVVAIIGGFSVMLVGSAKPRLHTYRLTEKGLFVGTRLVNYADMKRFAVHENPDTLAIETDTFWGTVHVPLVDVDYRAIEMELKNHDIEEVESLHSFSDHLARRMGI